MNLATIQKIIDIQPIPDAENIEVASVLGWKVVVKKGEFKIGDECVYIQIDTVVPEDPDFEFLRPRGFRIRTIKLRGQISQGLVLPLSIIDDEKIKLFEGKDVTDIIGVKKYEKPQPEEPVKIPKSWWRKQWWLFKTNYLYKWFPFLKPKPKIKQGNFPTHLVPKTDEERIQNIPYVLETYRDKRFVVSEKLDGSSITIIHDKGKLRICSRNYEVTGKKDNKFVQVVESINFKKHIDKLVETFGENVIVQGEFIGEPQGNKYELSNNEIRLFNIYVNGNRLPQDKFYNICFGLSIPTCPLITTFDNLNHFKSLDDILKYAENKSILNRKTEREGLVFRCIEDNLSFKVISNKFLIKNNE